MLKKSLYVFCVAVVLAVVLGWQSFSYDMFFLLRDQRNQLNRVKPNNDYPAYQAETIVKIVIGDKLSNVVIFSGNADDSENKTEHLQKLLAENDIVYSEIKNNFDDEDFKEILSKAAANKPDMYVVSADFEGKNDLTDILESIGNKVPVVLLDD